MANRPENRPTFENLGFTPEELWPEIHTAESEELLDESGFHPVKDKTGKIEHELTIDEQLIP